MGKVAISALAIILLSVNVGLAQSINLQQQIKIPAPQLQLEELLQIIAHQAGITYALNTHKFKSTMQVKVPKGTQSVASLLNGLKFYNHIGYTIIGHHIIFKDEPIQKIKVSIKSIHHTATSPAPIQLAPLPSSTPSASIPDIPNAPLHTTPPPIALVKIPPSITKPIKGNFFIRTGIKTEDYFYTGATLESGYKWFYLHGSWQTNYRNNAFSYGIGAAYTLSENTSLQLQATTGAFSVARDSMGVKNQVKIRFYRASLLLQKNISSSLFIRFGPQFNLFTYKYYSYNNYVASGMFYDRFFHYFNLEKPLYTLHNNYDLHKPNFTQLWVGLQFELIYRFK